MLAKVAPTTRDFHALARYLVHGASGSPHPHRVAWTLGHNLTSDDPDLAAIAMTATAALSPRTRAAVYHLMIAWHVSEQPSVELMQQIALATLQRAGLGEHQALIMGHGDTPHRHLHMMINRVHPLTGRAWKTSHDFARFDAIMRDLAGEHGFMPAPAHRYQADATSHLRKGPTSPAWRAGCRGAATLRPQLSRDEARVIGADINERLDAASSFDDIAFALAEQGLQLEAKGSGWVAGSSAGYVKVSHLGLGFTAHDLRNRSRVPLVRSGRGGPSRLFGIDGIDVLRAFVGLGLVEREQLAAAIEDVRRQRQARLGKAWSATSLVGIGARPSHEQGRAREVGRERRGGGRGTTRWSRDGL